MKNTVCTYGRLRRKSRRPVKVRLVGGAVAFLLSGAALAGTASGPAAAGGNFVHAQHNIQYTNRGAVIYVGEYDRPLGISVNEVCASALFDIASELGKFGYGQHNVEVVSSNSRCGGGPMFNMVLTLAPTQLVGSGYLYQGSGERRGWACILGQFGQSWIVCSTHLASADPPLAYLQSEQLRTSVMPSLGSGARVIGGDFNLRPRFQSDYNTQPWRSAWQEADDTCYQRNKDRRTVQPGPAPDGCDFGGSDYNVKIDYMWSSAFWFQDAYGVADIRCATGSDHCLSLIHR